jgi:hypothetical protein
VNNRDFIISFLRAKGFSNVAIAAILGNMHVESDLNPYAQRINDGGPGISSIGLCQWEGSRRTALQKYAASNHLTETAIEAQLGYLWLELHQQRFALSLFALQHGTDVVATAATFDTNYEGSTSASIPAREQWAVSYYHLLESEDIMPGLQYTDKLPDPNNPGQFVSLETLLRAIAVCEEILQISTVPAMAARLADIDKRLTAKGI